MAFEVEVVSLLLLLRFLLWSSLVWVVAYGCTGGVCRGPAPESDGAAGSERALLLASFLAVEEALRPGDDCIIAVFFEGDDQGARFRAGLSAGWRIFSFGWQHGGADGEAGGRSATARLACPALCILKLLLQLLALLYRRLNVYKQSMRCVQIGMWEPSARKSLLGEA